MPLLFSYGTLQEESVQLSTAGYRRVIAPLASGREAWVYADARSS